MRKILLVTGEEFLIERVCGIKSWHLLKSYTLSSLSCKIILLLKSFSLNFACVFVSKHFVSFSKRRWQFSFVMKYMILTDLSLSDCPPEEKSIFLDDTHRFVFTIDIDSWSHCLLTLCIVSWYCLYLINKVVFLVQYHYPQCDAMEWWYRKIPVPSDVFMWSFY